MFRVGTLIRAAAQIPGIEFWVEVSQRAKSVVQVVEKRLAVLRLAPEESKVSLA
jgi:hypothetical protein